MRSEFGFRRATLLVGASVVTLITSEPAQAQTVTLRSSDGSVTISAPLLSFDGNAYKIKIGVHNELTLAISEFSCISEPCPGLRAFGIHGSNTIGAALMPRLVEAYAQSRGEHAIISNGASPDESEIRVLGSGGENHATIDLQAHGSATATPGLTSGKALIGMASRALNEAELAQLAQQGLGDMRSPENEHVLALDGIIVIVSPVNAVTKLTLQQLQGIFSGALSDWSQVGGEPGKINVYARDSKSGTFDTFKTLVLDPGKQKLTGSAQRFESSDELSDSVTNDPRGIGFVGFAYLRNAKAISLVNDCGMSFTPTTFDVKTEEYPLSRRLFLYSGKLTAESYAAGLLDFAMSHQAQAIVRDSGFIDQELEIEEPSGGKLGRMADVDSERKQRGGIREPFVTLARDIQETFRLSTTLRFRSNSVDLDNKALKDIDVLARFLQFIKESKPTRKLVLAGFTDPVGAFDKNIGLSLERANAVRQALLRELRDPQYSRLIEVRGYGPTLPVACNQSEAGRDKNRRIEAWVK
jgi:phosphate transport system substrate-binding protein